MANSEEASIKLTNTHVNKLSAAKKNFQEEELSHQFFFKTRQNTKIRNVFAKNTSTDIKLGNVKYPK